MFTATASTAATRTLADDELCSALDEQRRELMAAQSLEADLDLAFQIQLQEAINASLALLPSSSSSTPPPPESQLPTLISPTDQKDAVSSTISLPKLQSEEISKLVQELQDRQHSELEMRRIREDLSRQIHDQKVAREILRIPDHDWHEWGDNFEKPFGEGCSRNAEEESSENSIFRLYFKGLVSDETVKGQKVILAGIGVAICDPSDNLVLEIKKPLIGNGMSKCAADIKALIEALNAAIELELKRVAVYCDCYPLYQYVIGRWQAKQRKIATLVNQVSLLQRKFKYCNPILLPRNDVKYAFKFARDAIVSQATKPAESSHGPKTVKETCVICLEDTDLDHIFSVDGCQHRYCFSCMTQHVEVKLLHGIVPKCPHEQCKTELKIDSCKKFLTAKLIETMSQRVKEASIPASEKIYCPYPQCSALMSKHEVSEYAKEVFVKGSTARKCMTCHGIFCIDCKVPWHSNMTCHEYKRMNPNLPDVKLKSLASRNLWRQCVKCNHMIELAEGCYHMTCRCGFEFCYNCGAEWKNKKATCSCPLWDENNIWYDEHGRDDEDDDDVDIDFDFDEYERNDSEYDYDHLW